MMLSEEEYNEKYKYLENKPRYEQYKESIE